MLSETNDQEQPKKISKPSDFDHFDEKADSSNQVSPIALVVERAMKDKDGNDKGYFTFPELAFRAMLLPNLHLTEDDVKNYIDQELQEGKLVEIEPGKYRPTTTQKIERKEKK